MLDDVLAKAADISPAPSTPKAVPLEQILDLARWAPSGDNTQCWRFEIKGPDHVVVHGNDTRRHCVYDLGGVSSQISIGALLETMAIASTRFGFRADISRRVDAPEEHPAFDVRFHPAPSLAVDPLVNYIESRTVNRKPFRPRPLTEHEREALSSAVGPNYRLVLRETTGERARMASLIFTSGKLRFTLPEAYVTHRDSVEWGVTFSNDRLPEGALGGDRMLMMIMRFGIKSWPRIQFLNRYLMGTWVPRIALDLIPSMACAAHFMLVADKPPQTIDDFVAGGRAMQRLWLTVAELGLHMQPQQTPLIFARYSRERIAFTQHPRLPALANAINRRLTDILGPADVASGIFMGRIGAAKPVTSRSLRLPLADLMVKPS